MAGFNYAQNIIGLKKGSGDIHELEVEVANLSASVLSIAGDVEDIELSISQLSASTLPYSDAQTIKQAIDTKQNEVSIVNVTFRYTDYGLWLKTNFSKGRQIIGVISTEYMIVDGGASSSYARIYSVGAQAITPAPTTNEITLNCVVIDI